MATRRAIVRALAIVGGGFAISCLPSAVSRPPTHDGPPPFQLVDLTFASGLRVVVQRDPSLARGVVVTSVIDGGSADDPTGKEGLAHVVEHLSLLRMRDASGATGAERLDRLGAGAYNAFTHADDTTFFVEAPADALPGLLAIEAARLASPLAGVEAADLDAERKIVRRELDERWLGQGAVTTVIGAVFPEGHRYHRSPETQESLDAITLDDARAFAGAHEQPSGTTVLVSGDVDLEKAKAAVLAAFPGDTLEVGSDAAKRIVATRQPRPQPKLSWLASGSTFRFTGPVAVPVVALVWPLPPGYGEDRELVDVSADVLERSIRAQLGPRYSLRGTGRRSGFLRERVDDVQCSAQARRDASFVLCTIVVAAGESPQSVVKDATWGLPDLPGQISSSWVFPGYLQRIFEGLSEPGRGVEGARFLHYTGRADRFPRSFGDLDALGAARVRAFAGRWLNRRHAFAAIVEPAKDSVPRAPASIAASAPDLGAGDLEPDTWFAGLTDAKIDKVGANRSADTMRELTLPNGLRTVILRRTGSPIAAAALYTNGGSAGSVPYGADAFVPLADDFHSSNPHASFWFWTRRSWTDGDLMGIEAPAPDAGPALDALLSRVKSIHAEYSSVAINAAIDELERLGQAALARPEYRAERARTGAIWNGDARGEDFDFERLRKLSQADAESVVGRRFAPKNATLVVVGDVDPAALEVQIYQSWGTWRASDTGDAIVFPAPSAVAGRTLVEAARPDEAYADLTVDCRLPPASGLSGAAQEVARELLEHRLEERLRSRAAATYGVHVALQRFAGGAVLLDLETRVSGDTAPSAIDAALDSIDAVAHGNARAEEVNRAKWILDRETQLEESSPEASLESLVALIRAGRTLDERTFRPRWVARVHAADLSAALAPCVGHEVISLVAPPDVLGAVHPPEGTVVRSTDP